MSPVQRPRPRECISPIAETCDGENYCFTRNGNLTVDYSGQTARLNQLTEIVSYLKTANTPGTALDLTQLLDMWSNAGGNGSAYFSAEAAIPGKNLSDKCFLPYVSAYEAYFFEITEISQSVQAAEEGIAGHMVSSTDPSKVYLLNANGMELTQIIEKGMMGDVFLYQANSTYLQGTLDGSFDNTNIVNADGGKHYTEAEHKFDEAFGYLGLPTDFPQITEGLRFHGKYGNTIDAAVGTNAIMDAFVEARTAITNGDDPSEAIDQVQYHWSRICAGTAIHYLKQANDNIEDQALKSHVLSEALAFIGNLVHASPFGLSADEVYEAQELLGFNFYQVDSAQIDATILYLVDHTSIELPEIASL